MKPFQHDWVVLFDHDGTVVDSETIALESAWRLTKEVAREFPGAQHYELDEFVKTFAGKPYREILKKIYADSLTSLNERDIDRLVAEEEKRAIERLTVEAKATQGTPEVLSYLRDDGFKYALVSNSSLQRLSACLTSAALTDYFPSEQIFSAHDSLPVPRPKPLPDIYLYAVKCLDAEVSDCVAIEDSLSGVRAAVAAGIGYIIGYVGGTHISEDERSSRADALQSAGAQQVIERMYDLIGLLSATPV
ncbi:HAD family phosphatase [Funiculus sociatus GB2-A5]|uniref:HAD family phosphatase n=1 Tax=Funiculus sociatus GB2-A5 TaxID=2933946 RepID=A0ABV0JLI0_9CYAN|nr:MULTISPECIES: HAD family phosphatase [unclassified Trichocoleus]MBD1908464.1 HAD family phosphatase [Trichocoleus sp. FACHB-832]MBD2061634.1 HAD family phosphatase [Trichocoleus sp. FACHB-6]